MELRYESHVYTSPNGSLTRGFAQRTLWVNVSEGILKRYWGILQENGLYVFCTQIIEFVLCSIRSGFISSKLGVKKLRIGPRSYLRGLSSIELGEDFSAGEGLWIEAITRYNEQVFRPRIVIGRRARITKFVHIAATHFVEIGDDVLIGSKVIITDHNHGQYSLAHSSPHLAPQLRLLDHDRKVVIGRNVWLGEGVVVAPGASIGEGSVIGANSVVLGSIPPFTIAVGAPAKVCKVFNFETGEWKSIN